MNRILFYFFKKGKNIIFVSFYMNITSFLGDSIAKKELLCYTASNPNNKRKIQSKGTV